MGTAPPFSWNLLYDFQIMWSYPFMLNAFRAGAIVAVVAGVVGWYVVLRRQTFAAHTLSVVAFPGAAFATLAGFALSLGYFGFCIAAALVLALLRRNRAGQPGDSEESAATGTVQAFLLACGYLFMALYKGLLEGPQALLFGSFTGITSSQVTTLAVAGVVVLGVLAVIGRPLLFASVDPQVAAARGVPVRALSVAFLVLLGAATAEAAQITGALLVFALMVLPAATAQVLTARPGLSLLLTVVIGFGVTWLGLFAGWYWNYPLGFFVTTFAFALFLLAHGARALAAAVERRRALPTLAGAA
ncbi:metal ABC transporter permease [Streptacidiphilus fuscans]|uniref:High-affinity zinc uptake system membrane protein ZnuB n=1 Tax=Streptacidiphilus fuscans TaxID=2789292 RepID=A0A931FEQ0_9ACTN|nr:metal ABC transporter permease [Streptacidiphilus fuscans]MBF9068901.1 metal ABC transporter permease [Streptacidiphilus fuscans]MBF9073355.1 metal ABC transporter permease [Streptacidiphilus fuscans]